MKSPLFIKWLFPIVFLAGVYFVSAQLGLSFALAHGNVSPIWPPSGIAFAVYWLLGGHAWIGIFIGAFLANAYLTDVGIPVALGIGFGNTVEAVVAVYLLRRRSPLVPFFQRRTDFIRFLGTSFALAPAIGATIGVLSLVLGGSASAQAAFSLWTTWWIGDAGGILIVAPIILSWTYLESRQVQWRRVLEAIACMSLLTFVAGSRYGIFVPGPELPLQTLLLIPVLVWAAIRLDAIGAATATGILALITTEGTLRGYGPFGTYPAPQALLMLQVFLGSVALTLHALSSVVTELKTTQLEVQAANRKMLRNQDELTRSNQELEQFAHIASHDLQEPLRVVTIYAELLNENYQAALPPDAIALAEGMAQESKRMSRLLQDLLAYSKAGAAQESEEPVSCEKALRFALGNLKISIHESGAKISYGALPWLKGNFAQVVQLFQNLVGNAIKYRGNKAPQIHIEASQINGEWVFSIRDNGIGFDSKYQEKIFRPFQRLHTQNKYPGTGIGLATCMKIVEQQGGRIWAESRQGEGSTFFFSVPETVSGPGRTVT